MPGGMGERMVDTSFLTKLHTARKRCKCSVYLHAFMDVNVGDDLFIHRVVSSYPDVHFVLISKKPYKAMLAQYPNVTVWEADGFPLNLCKKPGIRERILWHLSHGCDYGLYAGGSIFIEYSDWPNQHLWYQELFSCDRMHIIGCNWGPCRTKQFEDNMRAVFAGLRDICFRDQYSYRTFSALPNVRYAPDILFGMDWSAYRDRAEKKQVMISLVNCRSRSVNLAQYTSDYMSFLGCLTDRFVALGYHVVLCAFWERNGDLAAAQELRERLSPRVQKHTSITSYSGTNLERILELIAESEYIVATRFHAMILGLSAGKKVLPLIYNLKTRTVLEDLCFQGAYYDIARLPQDCSEVIPRISCGISDRDRERLSRLSAGHFDRLNELLK